MSRTSVRLIALQVTLAAAIGAGLWMSFPGWQLGRISERVRSEYRDLQFITTADLSGWLAHGKEVHPLLLDVRTTVEYEVSHLIDARHVAPEAELPSDQVPADRRRDIVVYCSDGERSAAFARRLQRAGHQSVFVLDGAIVRWANEQRPMTNGRDLVTRVLPADPKTAALLEDAHRASP